MILFKRFFHNICILIFSSRILFYYGYELLQVKENKVRNHTKEGNQLGLNNIEKNNQSILRRQQTINFLLKIKTTLCEVGFLSHECGHHILCLFTQILWIIHLYNRSF